ncbi:MAG TPA: bifunctional tRNA (5-methylaminomethyl-2-thiouridine)(34)-methyltransferase MnmD/FAD-dependent 5-carboxymethylaminomethyl-2-thiouridine(34) oxidoreductase MnmC [Methylophilaceae bacterium]|jgi:tRNA 5-methylaminomethyl-2-thiouridine biosynthesis bifunctional protein
MPKPEANIFWKEGQPYSTQYEDVYFSSDSGIDETEYVFIQHNQLEQRFKALPQNQFTIVETGFGTGLNFLCAWALWDKTAPKHARLNFVSTELHPLTASDLSIALKLWPSLENYAQQLIAQYQNILPGMHQLAFSQDRVNLTLLIGDVTETLPTLHASVDAWFLDGFSPAKNPQMWQTDLFSTMANISHADTTFATFTSAGVVRRGLQAAGFEVQKAAGFGKKREMLFGQFSVIGLANNKASSKPKIYKKQTAIVIGGGISGTTTSYALAKRGLQVTLIERHKALAQEASGNPAGVLYPRLGNPQDKLSQFALAGYLYSLRLLNQLNLSQEHYQTCGVLQLAFNAREQARCDSAITQGLPDSLLKQVNQDEASTLACVDLNAGGIFFPTAGWVNPSAWCTALTKHENIKIKTSTQAIRIIRTGDVWQVLDRQNCIAEADIVILACAKDVVQFEQSSHCVMQTVRGQVTLVPSTSASEQLRTVVCSEGYITPTHQQMHCLGATFSTDDHALDVREADHLHNLGILQEISPALYDSLKPQALKGRVAFRSTTKDYFPLLGPLLDAKQLNANPPRYNDNPCTLPWLDGLYVNAGHGSKGLISAPLCAEVLASIICGEPVPIAKSLMSAIEPNRFALRALGLKLMASHIYDQSIQ